MEEGGRGGEKVKKFEVETYRCHLVSNCHMECCTGSSTNLSNSPVAEYLNFSDAPVLVTLSVGRYSTSVVRLRVDLLARRKKTTDLDVPIRMQVRPCSKMMYG